MNVKIVIDGGCDISKEKLQQLDIEMLPIYVSNEEQVFEEEIPMEELFKRMRGGEVFMTSQVSTQLYIDCFTKYAKEGRDVVYICLSSGISGTCASSIVVAGEINKEYGEKIHVFDSKLATMGLGYAVERAAELAKKGKSVEDIIRLLEFYKKNLNQNFSVTSLEFLMRGGRLSRTEALIGGLLNIRPMIKLSREEGKLEVYDKARGDKAMIKKFLDNLDETSLNQTIILGYGDSREYAEKIKEAIMKKYSVKEEQFRMDPVGPVIGVHVGPEFVTLEHITADENKFLAEFI